MESCAASGRGTLFAFGRYWFHRWLPAVDLFMRKRRKRMSSSCSYDAHLVRTGCTNIPTDDYNLLFRPRILIPTVLFSSPDFSRNDYIHIRSSRTGAICQILEHNQSLISQSRAKRPLFSEKTAKACKKRFFFFSSCLYEGRGGSYPLYNWKPVLGENYLQLV